MINNVSNATQSAAQINSQMEHATGMGPDDFMRLFLAQLQNQDPLNPQDPTQFVSQLATMTQVQQSYNASNSIKNLITASQNQMQMSAASFVGQSMTADASTLTLVAGSQPVELQVNSPSALTSATMTVTDANGKVVASSALGPLPSGITPVTWDGKANGVTVPAGTYTVTVTGQGSSGAVTPTVQVGGVVSQVSFAGDNAQLISGRVSVGLSSLQSVGAKSTV